MAGVPFVFGNATTSIPLSNLDADFNTPVTIGSTTVGLGNTVTSLVGLSNVTTTNAIVTNLTLGGTQNQQLGQGNASTLKNRIINGAMVIDQRNAGASQTITTANQYTVDRWQAFATQSSKYTAQQNAGSVTPPAGFTNYLGITSSSAYSISSSDYFFIRQGIEGYNISDLAWGTAFAKTITLSFQVYSSLTGTFGGCLGNSASNRTYPFSYTVSVANTWTTAYVTIAGDTTGTWGTTSGGGIYVYFGLGVGSTYSGTAGAWSANNYFSATGATSVVGTSGATFYITGVQLEVGSSATGFEYRQYGTELALCQRYFQLLGQGFTGNAEGTTAISINEKFQVPMRAVPTSAIVSGQSCYIRINGGDTSTSSPTLTAPTTVVNSIWTLVGGFSVLTANSPIQARNSTTSSLFISVSAEL